MEAFKKYVRRGGGSLKSERKQTGSGSSLSVGLLCEKNCLIFQTANSSSDELLGVSHAFLSLAQHINVFIQRFFMNLFFFMNIVIVIVYITV